MGTPKKRQSRSRRDKRRANHNRITMRSIGACSNCGEPKLPHRVCGSCGQYRGEQILPAADV